MFPFHNITNEELVFTLDSVEKNIRRKLDDCNFNNYIKNRCMLDSGILNQPFSYTNTENLSQLTTSTNQYTILHHNIRSLDKHFNKLIALLEQLHLPDIVPLTEIGRKNVENRKFQLTQRGYDIKFELPIKVRGGAALIYKNTLNPTERKDLKIKRPENIRDLDIENTWHEIDLPGIGPTVIAVIYKHPNSTTTGLKYFKDQLRLKLQQINTENKCGLIAGDINIDGVRINDDLNRQFFDMVLEESFIPIVTLPTRIQNESCTTIDHIFINLNFAKKSPKRLAGNLFCDISDHLPNYLILSKTNKSSAPKEARPYVRIYGENNMKKFQQSLSEANWKNFYNQTDAEKALKEFYKIYDNNFEKSFPLKQLSRKKAKNKSWFTSYLNKRVNLRDKCFQTKVLNPTPANTARFIKIRNEVNRELQKAEDEFYSSLMNKEKNNLKYLWEIAGKIINPGKIKQKGGIKSLKIKGKLTSCNIEIANGINKFFSTIGEELANKIKTKTDFKRYLQNRRTQSMTLQLTDVPEVTKIIQSLKSTKSAGHDGIRPGHLKSCGHILTEPITHLINLSLSTGKVPSQLKLARVIPVYKKDDPTEPGNYRPISLLSIINKILEKVMCKQLTNFLEKQKIIYKYQFGFRKKHSTVQAVIEIVENIIEELDKGNTIAGLYLDLSKAFDCVDHEILLYKLNHYGIRGLPLKWLTNYLTDRSQYTAVNGVESATHKIKYGVPQGSVLGPLLFLIYVNDISSATPQHQLRLFADDSNVFITTKDPATLKPRMTEAITQLSKWFAANKLTSNMKKTAYTIFSKHKLPESLQSIEYEGVIIKHADSTKYLGITLDKNLNWEEHIKALNTKLSKTIQALKIIKSKVQNKNKLMLFSAYITSRIQYGIEIYSTANTKLIKSVQTLQNRALKVLFNKDYLTPTTQLHKELKTLLVRDIAKLNTLKFVHNQRSGTAPEVFNNYYKPNSEVRTRCTRQDNNLHCIKASPTTRKSIKYRGAVQWNAIPKEIRQALTTKAFAQNYKKLTINNY